MFVRATIIKRINTQRNFRNIYFQSLGHKQLIVFKGILKEKG